jgi:hypothetical protein
MLRLALLSTVVVLIAGLAAGEAGATRADSGASLANQVVQVFQQYASIVTGNKGGCAKVGGALRA